MKERGNWWNVGVYIQKQGTEMFLDIQNKDISHNGSTNCNKISFITPVDSEVLTAVNTKIPVFYGVMVWKLLGRFETFRKNLLLLSSRKKLLVSLRCKQLAHPNRSYLYSTRKLYGIASRKVVNFVYIQLFNIIVKNRHVSLFNP